MAKLTAVLLTAAPIHMAAEAAGAFVKIDGKEAMLRSAELFMKREEIAQILLALMPGDVEDVKKRHAAYLGFSGVKIVAGEPTWVEQITAAAEKLAPDSTHVLLHDAARPAVPFTDIDAIIAASEKSQAVVLATPVRGPLIETDHEGKAIEFVPQGKFMLMQTPIVLSRARFLKVASEKSAPLAGEFTMVKGSPLNVRLGGSGDAALVSTMMGMLPKPKLRGPDNPFEEAKW